VKKRFALLLLIFLMATLFAGCALRTVADMYAIPKRSKEFKQLQVVIDQSMTGLEYSAPLSGENRQTVQLADLNGDGQEEYILFAKGGSEAPLHIFVFSKEGDTYSRIGLIQSNGSAFEQVEYVNIDGKPGMEIVVGSQLSNQVLRNVAVYSFADGESEQLLSIHYAYFLTCDLDPDGYGELMAILPGESETNKARAALYSFREGIMERSVEAELSGSVDSVKRIMVSKLHGGIPAVYVASSVDESAIITDIFAVKDGRFTNISFSNESGTSVQTLRNYYIYADDIDDDGILELPGLITTNLAEASSAAQQHLIRWFAMDLEGEEVDKRYTFHNFPGGWYLRLEGDWAKRVSVSQDGSTYTFSVWNEEGTEAERIMTVHVLSGKDREEAAVIENRFVLHRTESVVYAAKLDAASVSYGITQDSLINCFHLIFEDWNMGET